MNAFMRIVQVQRRIQAMAGGMLSDKRLLSAQSDSVPHRQPAIRNLPVPERVALGDTILEAALGRYGSLGELRQAVHATSARIRVALQQTAEVFAMTPCAMTSFSALT